MDNQSRDQRFIRKPIFKGGNKDFSKFLYSNLKYPKAALENKIEGTVIVRYEIGHKGDVVKAKVISKLGHGCDEEAVRVIKLMKFEIPKGPRKLKIKFHRTTKVKFVLPKVEKKVIKAKPTIPSKGLNLSYQYKKEPKPKDAELKKKPAKVYNYNVTW